MPAVPAYLPANEHERLAALHTYDVLDTAPEAAFDDLTKVASYICDTPISVISLIDRDRQWFKSEVGLGVRETPRDQAFCAHAILQEGVFVVPDASADTRFAGNPLVKADPNIRFYAGAPLVTPDGYALGTLCVIDRVPRTLTAEQMEALRALSRQVVAQLEMRRNLAELHVAYTRLHAVDQLKSEFVSMVSHELRTPLTSIRGGLQLVLADPDAIADPNARELLDRALHSSERLIRLTNDILDLSKVEAGRMELHRSACRAADIIANACAAVAHLPYGADRVRAPNSERGGELFVDADRIVQAVVNLLANGLKFTPPPGLVYVETRRHDTAVEIAVRDEGPGMTPEDLARLFQPFQQLASARKVGGTGLGLVISRAIVEQHGGQLTVDSRVGEGTTFTISLPLAPAG